MGELGERRWAVISERGCEASSLGYTEAVELVRRLLSRKVHGICIVTDEAASHLAPAKAASPGAPTEPVKTHGQT
jgi:hypothetical protein